VSVDAGYGIRPPVERVRRAVSERGVRPVAADIARFTRGWLAGQPRVKGVRGVRGGGGRGSAGGATFTLGGRTFPYLFHPYKHSWLTERAVEVPVARAVVEQYAAGRILEVGNVLGHYRAHSHLVVDKYEHEPDVVNRDVLELEDLGKFDLIVAISTLEHVGQDELPREPDKAARAALALRERLAPGGRLLVTVPIGYNAAFDAALRDGTLPVSEASAMERIGSSRRWREVSPDAVSSARYDFLLYAARAVLFAFIDAPSG
jgi:SAM-dependent methyltransferase